MKASILQRIKKIEFKGSAENDLIVVIEGRAPENPEKPWDYRSPYWLEDGKITSNGLFPGKISPGKRVVLRCLPGVNKNSLWGAITPCGVWQRSKSLRIEPASPAECKAWQTAYADIERYLDIFGRAIPPFTYNPKWDKWVPIPVSDEEKVFFVSYYNDGCGTKKSFEEIRKEVLEYYAEEYNNPAMLLMV